MKKYIVWLEGQYGGSVTNSIALDADSAAFEFATYGDKKPTREEVYCVCDDVDGLPHPPTFFQCFRLSADGSAVSLIGGEQEAGQRRGRLRDLGDEDEADDLEEMADERDEFHQQIVDDAEDEAAETEEPDHACAKCHAVMTLREGATPTPECDPCAQDLLAEFRAKAFTDALREGTLQQEIVVLKERVRELTHIATHAASSIAMGRDAAIAHMLALQKERDVVLMKHEALKVERDALHEELHGPPPEEPAPVEPVAEDAPVTDVDEPLDTDEDEDGSDDDDDEA